MLGEARVLEILTRVVSSTSDSSVYRVYGSKLLPTGCWCRNLKGRTRLVDLVGK